MEKLSRISRIWAWYAKLYPREKSQARDPRKLIHAKKSEALDPRMLIHVKKRSISWSAKVNPNKNIQIGIFDISELYNVKIRKSERVRAGILATFDNKICESSIEINLLSKHLVGWCSFAFACLVHPRKFIYAKFSCWVHSRKFLHAKVSTPKVIIKYLYCSARDPRKPLLLSWAPFLC